MKLRKFYMKDDSRERTACCKPIFDAPSQPKSGNKISALKTLFMKTSSRSFMNGLKKVREMNLKAYVSSQSKSKYMIKHVLTSVSNSQSIML